MSSEPKQIKKLYYSIGEVSKITELKAYVLRYWETEFKQLKPFMDCPFPVVRKNILGALLNSKGFKTLPQEDKVYWLKYAIEHYEPEKKE